MDQSYSYMYQVGVADFDRDGVVDMVAPSSGLPEGEDPFTARQKVIVLRGNGDGTFEPGERYPAQVSSGGMCGHFFILVADLNRDQIPDIVMRALPASGSSTPDAGLPASGSSTPDATIVARLGNGDCTFGPEIGLAAGTQPCTIVVTDLDGDGIPDLANTSEAGERVTTYHGNGDGSFSNRQDWAVGGAPTTLTVTDWNSDGIPDLVATDSYLHVLLGTGNGRFAPVIDCAVSIFAVGATPPALAPVIADLDGDGTVDVVTNDTILFGMHECNFTKLATFPVSYNSALPLVAGDFNGDGALDLAFTAWEGVGFMPGDGKGNFGKVVVLGDNDHNPNIYGTSALAGDFNGDGRLDLMVANGSSVRIFLNTCQ